MKKRLGVLMIVTVGCANPTDMEPPDDGGETTVNIVERAPCLDNPPDPMPRAGWSRWPTVDRYGIDKHTPAGPTVDIRVARFSEEHGPYWQSLCPGAVVKPGFLIVSARCYKATNGELARGAWGYPGAPPHTYPIRGVMAVAGSAIDDFAHPSELRVPLREVPSAPIGNFGMFFLGRAHPFEVAELPGDGAITNGTRLRIEHFSQRPKNDEESLTCDMWHYFHKLSVFFSRGCDPADRLSACFGVRARLEPYALGRHGAPMYVHDHTRSHILTGMVDEGAHGEVEGSPGTTLTGYREGLGRMFHVGELIEAIGIPQ